MRQFLFKGLFLIVGLGLMGLSFYLYQDTRAFLSEAATAQGEIIDFEVREDRTNNDGRVDSSYHPVIRFDTQEGSEITFTSSSGSGSPSYDIGEKVEVLYSPSEPRSAKINGFFSLWGGALISGLLGVAFFFSATGSIIKR